MVWQQQPVLRRGGEADEEPGGQERARGRAGQDGALRGADDRGGRGAATRGARYRDTPLSSA